MKRGPLLGTVFAAAIVLEGRGEAQQADGRAWAQTLFEEGRALIKAGKVAEACEKFAASEKLDPAVGTLLNLGDCNERLQSFATAWASYKEAISLAHVKKDAEREARARSSAARVEPKISRLTIRVAEPAPSIVVKRGQDEVPENAWGVALPVDGGKYLVRASAPDRTPFETVVTIGVSGDSAVVEIPRLALASPHSQPASTPAQQAQGSEGQVTPSAPTPAPPPKEQARPHGNRLPAYLVMSAGVVATGVGTYFAIHAHDQWADAKPGCNAANQCAGASFTLAEDAHANGNGATVAFAIGGVAIVTGIALWFLLGPSNNEHTSIAPMPGGFAFR